ncbi:radical SAM protein [Plesiocystis pacifica]|nr:radical SAM protein [Plesiocystis pacifica]
MPRLMLRLTTDCNSGCHHCTVADVPADQTRAPREALAELVQARKQGSDELVFMRGEPTLRPDLPALAKAARKVGYRLIQIQTNGRRLCYAPYLDKLLAAGVDYFEVSLFGATAATNDAVSVEQGAFEQTLAGLRLLAERGVQSGGRVGTLVTFAVLRANLHELTAAAELVAELGLSRLQYNFTRPVRVDGAWRREVLARLDEAGPPLRAAMARARELGLWVSTEAVPLCQLDPADRGAAEQARDFAEVRVVDFHQRHESFAQHHRVARPLGPRCPECAVVDRCPTTWRAYQELFGTDELRPLAEPDADVPS